MLKESAKNITLDNQWYSTAVTQKISLKSHSRIQNRMLSFYFSLQQNSWLLMAGASGSIDKISGVTNLSVSVPSYYTHLNF